MFSKLFGKKQPYTKIEANADTLRFLGAPTGGGLKALEEELAAVLRAERNTARAYLSKIQYPNEERIRVALVIDGLRGAEQMAPAIARGCQPIAGIDIVFFESLTDQMIQEVESLSPFYVAKDA